MLSLLLLASCLQDGPSDRWDRLRPLFETPEGYRGKLAPYDKVLRFDDGTPVTSAEDWPRRREEIRKYWFDTIGHWPPLLEKPEAQVKETVELDGYTRRKIRLQTAPQTHWDVYLLVPRGEGPFPAVVVVGYTSEDGAGIGKRHQEALAAAADPTTVKPSSLGTRLAETGVAVLAFGGGSSSKDIQPLSSLAYQAANVHRYLSGCPEIDGRRIGIFGHSFGGKWALFASALYDRFVCAVWSDPGIVWNEKDANANYWEPWYLGMEPNVKRTPGKVTPENPRTGAYKKMLADGRDLHDLHALMAPRPFLVTGGKQGQDPPDRWIVLNNVRALYEMLGRTPLVGMHTRPGHPNTPESLEASFDFFHHVLRPN
ncbi:MAG TPA: prolyl oligopeptidase family serine peptidase [Planctomycetota bacterium]|nr:prolyl oligopeptidase family serine peptidase [Planctomycetota bacterium]